MALAVRLSKSSWPGNLSIMSSTFF